MFQVGIASWACETDGILDALRRIARHGFREVELWCNYTHLDPRLEPGVGMVREVLSEEGLRAVSLHAPFEFRGQKLSVEAAWEAWETLMNQLLEAAQFLGVSFIVVHPVLVCSPSNRHQGEVEVAGCQEQSLKRVARLAGERGIRVALENLQRKTAPAFADVRALVELARRLGEDNVGICLDTGHCLVSGLDPLQELDHGVSQLCSFHLHENDGVEDLHWVPGKGPIDWPRFFDKLRAARYDGSFVLEIWGGKNAEDIMKEARAFAERYDLMGTS